MSPMNQQSNYSSSNCGEDVAPQVNVLASCYIVGTAAQLKGLHYCTTGVTGKDHHHSKYTSTCIDSASRGGVVFLSRRRDRRGGAALVIREECERFFCEPMKTVFRGERNLSMHGSGLTGAYLQTPPPENQLRARADRRSGSFSQQQSADDSQSNNGKAGFEVDAWMEVWDYVGGASFRAFLASNDDEGEKSLFIFFDMEGIMGRDLKKALMALIELADGPLGCGNIVTCMDRRMPVDEALELTKSLQWVGFEMTTLDHWANDVDVTSDQWVFMGMEL
ncbi:hypothetical protein LLEC1_03732 [Akanthomyces lecanii]|uniref:Ornithine decarboxylase antizyme n=1 Tax=Cordyceps confragosa TaxID=2714763 RepID=A0A179I3I6_CORDF|nr:hypothetical protein LLEC1_03732 [Akanthomyces lecanii]